MLFANLPILSHQPALSQNLPVSASPLSPTQGVGLPQATIRFAGEGEKPPEEADKPQKRKGWFSGLGKVVDKAKKIGGQATAAVTATVKETVKQWQGKDDATEAPKSDVAISPDAPPIVENPSVSPAGSPDIAGKPVEVVQDVIPQEQSLPPAENNPTDSTLPPAPPVATAPAKKSVIDWVRQSVPGVGQAMSYIDEQMKGRFLKELLQQTEATTLLPRLNGFAKEDLQTALTQHPSRDRAFYRTVFSEVSDWVTKQEGRRQYATAETFLNEHWTQLVQQSETVQQFQARMAVYKGVADLLSAQGEMLQGMSPDGVDTTPLGLGTDWRTTFKVLDDIQQTHPPLWQLMTVLGKGAGKTGEKQANSVLFGNFMLQLLSLRDSIQPNRFRMMAQWLDKVPQDNLDAFVQQPDNYTVLRSDLGAAMPEAWWERYHREQLAKPESVQAPAATLMRALYELADMLTPAY
jgi:hypothetical protein